MNTWDLLHRMARQCHYAIWLYDLRGYIGYTRLGPCSYIDALESAIGSCEELDEYLTSATEQ